MGIGRTASPSPADAAKDADGAGAIGHQVRGLDGLRAASMAVVLLYHGEIPSFAGGFLGISTFFTLSGFLITSMLLRDHDASGRIDLRSFWARRFRRLLPAAYLTLAGILVFGATVATQQQLQNLPGAVVASVAEVANWFFIRAGQSYVALFSAPSPVQHFWSLAIEEQFYLLMPIGLMILLRRRRPLWIVGAALAAAALASTALMRVLFDHGASLDRLYYGTDTRAAELLVGALLAVVLHARPLPRSGNLRRVFPALGAICAVVVVWSWTHVGINDVFLYRGGFLLVALASAGLIVSVLDGRGPVAAVLSIGPVAAFGRITYGVYLFHWPLFLWLTADRTGLGRWPLLGVRVAVTVAAATASYHWLEMPIRRRSWPRVAPNLRWVIPPVAACLLLGAFAIGQRNVHTDLAGLGVAPGAIPTVAAHGDGVLHVLVIADRSAASLGTALLRLDQSRNDLRVTVAAPFSCDGVESGPPTICKNWAREWPSLVQKVDPDVVLFQVTDWATSDISRLSGAANVAAQTTWATATLNAGFDLLTKEGATIVWGEDPPASFAAAQRHNNAPYYLAMQRITSERSDVRRRAVLGRAIGPLLDDLRLYRRRDANAATRIMVVGDSVAQTMGYGLQQWSGTHPNVVVWSAATEGCGIADAGTVLKAGGRHEPVPANCRGVVERWAQGVKKFRPDIVIVLSAIFDLQSRHIDGWSGFLGPADTQFDDYLVNAYADAYDALSSTGAQVIWVKNPCVHYLFGNAGGIVGSFDNTRIRYANDIILGRLAKVRPKIRFFDLYHVLCPNGQFVNNIGGVNVIRTDGVHFSPAGSRWFANTYAQQLLDLGRH